MRDAFLDLMRLGVAALGTVAGQTVDLLDQRNIFSYPAAALFVLTAVLVRRARRGRRFRLGALWRLIARRSVWLHRSALFDYRLFLVNFLLTALVLGAFVIGTGVWSGLFGHALRMVFGAPSGAAAGWPAIVLIVLLQMLALDGGYWLSHAAMHKSEILWQFHKVHHSAETLTPATEYRQHPVELVMSPSLMALTTGFALALSTQVFGAAAAHAAAFWFNITMCGYILTIHHLRHSHIDMAATGLLGVLIHSPAHHRLHHSADPAHFDRNLGYMLSVWDWLAGTLHMPRPGERVGLGLGEGQAAHASLTDALWMPLRDAAALVGRRIGRPAPRAALNPTRP